MLGREETSTASRPFFFISSLILLSLSMFYILKYHEYQEYHKYHGNKARDTRDTRGTFYSGVALEVDDF